MQKILVIIPLNDAQKETLRAAAAGCDLTFTTDPTPEELRAADIIVGNPSVKKLEASPKLELLQLYSAGADPYIVPGALNEKTVLCNATGAYGKSVGEHALALTLALLKNLPLYRDGQQKKIWKDLGPVTSITDATVLIVGLGDIGCAYANYVKGLGAKKVIGLKRREAPLPENVDELYLTADIMKVLPEADIIFTILPGSAKGFFTADHFAAMKESAIFINCGRGNVVDGAVLKTALEEGQIKAAAIDVTDPEPLPADSPLWAVENLFITPHVAGYPHLAHTTEVITEIAAENIRAFLSGAPLRNVVDFETGYKK